MARLKKHQDAYGQAMYDHCHGKAGYEINERDDGFISVSEGPPAYLAEYKDWLPHQQRAIARARAGGCWMFGCGAGRVALHLQEKGLDVLGVDISPLAIKVCRERGVKRAKVLPVTQVSRRLGEFDTIVMFGNNFGLFGSFKRACWLLRRFHRLTGADARILAESRDPYQTDVACHHAYQRRNRRRGRMSGQLRIKVRYQTLATPFFDYLLVSRDELREILAGTGWRAARFFDGEAGMYIAEIVKE